MKKHITTILLIVVFLAGLGLLMYPTISDFINKAHQSAAIDSYEQQIANLSKKDYSEMLGAARAYNQRITTNEFPANDSDLAGNADYMNALNPGGNGIMGYIKIDKIDVRIPIYHTSTNPVLQIGIGHMPMTSLPVGGTSTHSVLLGHRGLPSSKLFSDLDKMQIDDVFYIYVLDEVLAYKVDQIKTVEPTDTSDLQIVKGQDYVTLVTCTPYGINSHRLLVRGVRILYESTIADKYNVSSEAHVVDPEQAAAFLGAPILITLLIIILVKRKKLNGKGN